MTSTDLTSTLQAPIYELYKKVEGKFWIAELGSIRSSTTFILKQIMQDNK